MVVYLSEFWQCPRQDCTIQDWPNMPTPNSSSFLKTDSTFFFPQFYPITQIANFHILLSHPSFHILLPTQNSHYNLKLLLYHTILSLLKNKILCILGSYDQFPEKLEEYFSVQESRYCTCVYTIFFFRNHLGLLSL